jgi:ATP-dependent Clp protease ATP-binding subunit ClpA
VIEIAFEEAKRMNNTYVGTEHLLLGLLIEGEGVAAHVLDDMGANLDKVRPELDSLLQGQRLPDELPAGLRPRRSRQGGSPQVAGHFVHSVFHDLGQFTSEANSAMALAEEEAAKAGLGYLGTEHLLLGLIRQSEGVAAQALGNLGVTLAGVRLELASEQRDLRHLAVPQLNPSRRFVKAVTSLAPLEVANLPTHLLDTQHLLLAITADGDDPAARVLAALGVSASALREEVQRLEGDSAA